MEVIGFHLDDVLDLAIQMESNGSDFYELAARSAPQGPSRLLLGGLAAMERAHAESFRGMKQRQTAATKADDREVDEVVSGFLACCLDGEVFEADREKALEVARSSAMADVLRLAIRMEKDSIAFYAGLREFVADEAAEKLLEKIIKEELRHVAELSGALLQLR